MNVARYRKAIAAFLAPAVTLGASLLAANVLHGTPATWLAGLLAVATPAVTMLTVAAAPKNAEPEAPAPAPAPVPPAAPLTPPAAP